MDARSTRYVWMRDLEKTRAEYQSLLTTEKGRNLLWTPTVYNSSSVNARLPT